jgi:hypothetical protein
LRPTRNDWIGIPVSRGLYSPVCGLTEAGRIYSLGSLMPLSLEVVGKRVQPCASIPGSYAEHEFKR